MGAVDCGTQGRVSQGGMHGCGKINRGVVVVRFEVATGVVGRQAHSFQNRILLAPHFSCLRNNAFLLCSGLPWNRNARWSGRKCQVAVYGCVAGFARGGSYRCNPDLSNAFSITSSVSLARLSSGSSARRNQRTSAASLAARNSPPTALQRKSINT